MIWDRAAPGWHRHQDNLDAGEAAVTDRLLVLAGIGPGQRVLDLACGVGDPAFALAQQVGSSGAVLGLDLSAAMVEAAQARALEQGFSHAQFRQIASEAELGVPDEAFDAATCRFGLMFFPDPVRALAAVRQALKPGGRIAVSTWGPPERVPYFTLAGEIVRRHAQIPTPPHRLTTSQEVAQVLQDAGFTAIETESVEAVALAADSAPEFWDTVVEVAGPLGTVLGALPEATRLAIRDDAVRTLSELFPIGPVRLGGEAVVAAGTKPVS
jgi:ubiquinone/menaquinone biosynthesis C-methylase UbiE